MMDFESCKPKNPSIPNNKSPKITSRRSLPALPPVTVFSGEITPASDTACAAYDAYFRLPELRLLWGSKEFPGWDNELIIKPALQALEITFRFISLVLNDPRPYVNRREWERRLEMLVKDQVELISILCDEDETRGAVPIVDIGTSSGAVVPYTVSSAEVWKLEHDATVVSRTSESSLLPRLATWQKSTDIADRIHFSIEAAMKRCVFTLGLGEPNLEGKPNLDYDAVCHPCELHALKKPKNNLLQIQNQESSNLIAIHQIFESWVFTAEKVLEQIGERLGNKEFSKAANNCWLLERIWKLLEQIVNLHLIMDPNDFLILKTQLKLKTTSHSEMLCFRSRGLVQITCQSKDLRHRVPEILAVQVDPMGGPILQEAAMAEYRERRRFEKVHLLQAFQGVESGVKRFYFNYKQVLVVMVGSLDAQVQKCVMGSGPSDLMSQIFMEPTYYPSLDGAKTFLGDFLEHDRTARIKFDHRTK